MIHRVASEIENVRQKGILAGTINFILWALICCVGSVSATAYNGESTTDNDPAIYYSTLQSPSSGASFNGYVSFNGGLTLPGSSGNITLNTVGMIGGVLTFTDSTSSLTLSQDLWCRPDFSISGGGTINAASGQVIRLAEDLSLNTAITIGDGSSLVIDGGGCAVTLGAQLSIGSVNPASLTLRNMDLLINNGPAPISFTTGSTLTLENVNIYLAVNINAAETWVIAGACNVIGQGQKLTNQGSITINNYSTLSISKDVTFSMFDGSSAVTMGGSAATLTLDNCTLDTSAANFSLLKGMLVLDNQVLLKATGHTLTLGDGTGGNDILVKVLSDAYVTVDGTLYHRPS